VLIPKARGAGGSLQVAWRTWFRDCALRLSPVNRRWEGLKTRFKSFQELDTAEPKKSITFVKKQL
jgi:hypothetical protein